MLNCQQVKSIIAGTQEELQDLLNEELRKLGKRVQKIDFINPLCEGYGVNVIYWSQDIQATMTYKLETLPDEPEATKESGLFVCVMHEKQREMAEFAIRCLLDIRQFTADRHPEISTDTLELQLIKNTLDRFTPDDTEEQFE